MAEDTLCDAFRTFSWCMAAKLLRCASISCSSSVVNRSLKLPVYRLAFVRAGKDVSLLASAEVKVAGRTRLFVGLTGEGGSSTFVTASGLL